MGRNHRCWRFEDEHQRRDAFGCLDMRTVRISLIYFSLNQEKLHVNYIVTVVKLLREEFVSSVFVFDVGGKKIQMKNLRTKCSSPKTNHKKKPEWKKATSTLEYIQPTSF